jgi:hypothetical protein
MPTIGALKLRGVNSIKGKVKKKVVLHYFFAVALT